MRGATRKRYNSHSKSRTGSIWSPQAASARRTTPRPQLPSAIGRLSSERWSELARCPPPKHALPRFDRLRHLRLARFRDRIACQEPVEYVSLDLPVRHRREVEDEEAEVAAKQQVARAVFRQPRKAEHRAPQEQDRDKTRNAELVEERDQGVVGVVRHLPFPGVRPEADHLLKRGRLRISVDVVHPDVRARREILALIPGVLLRRLDERSGVRERR